MSPQVSILLPIYNAESYLTNSIDSILSQTFSNWELIVVDDGSTDQSRSIVESYSDSRIHLLSCSHNFIASLNAGIKASSGKYIARMDADDIMLPHRLQTQWDFMEAHPEVDVCGSWMETFGERTGIWKTSTKNEEIITTLLLHNTMFHPTIILRKSILKSSELYAHGYPCAEDYKLWTDLVLQGCCFANIPEVLLRYRVSRQQVTNNHKEEMIVSTHKIQLEYAEQIMEKLANEDEIYTAFLNSLIDLVNANKVSRDIFLQIVYQVFKSKLAEPIKRG
ncbi:glycosyltransferase [Bacteroides sp. 519]|uniref:glycosyltransferase family 2 protein n=1 Tax=Bacteroides sp. 519 TaxID=2302937 RepID=UPI0013D8AD1C|nr:glycosyltransferase [Bacteroides sp. 519]NDV60660.1 glycosyltransferase [Bacteroides sp. 519]